VSIGQLPNATALFSVVRNVGGSAGVAIATTLLSRRAQTHQSALAAHVNVWDSETAERLRQWTEHFLTRGADTVTAGRQAVAMLYREMQVQAQVLAFMDDFRVLAAMYAGLVVLVLLMRRIRPAPAQAASPAEPLSVSAE
jgi:DHA2 family multidrug resistance protein